MARVIVLPKQNNESYDAQPIVACCTARGAGAIALIRISGVGALTVADSLARLPGGMALSSVPTHTIQYGKISDTQGVLIDTVLFLVMHSPRTFTGQETVEITCHNNPFLIDTIIDAALAAGARQADPGEFSKRAVLAGKLDLVQAEALREFIHAGTMQGLKASYAQLSGSLSAEIAVLEKRLLHALALANASFEFIEEENLQFLADIKADLNTVSQRVNDLLALFPLQQQLREGARIVLVGSVNAGKSSLFNALLGTNRAIVTPIAGTTRDVIEAGVYRNGEHQTFIDTAGIRYTDDQIEQAGIERSHAEAARADLVLIIIDRARAMNVDEKRAYDELTAKHAAKALLVYTKADLPSCTQYEPPVPIAAHTVSVHAAATMSSLLQIIDERRQQIAHVATPYLLTERQCRLLEQLQERLTGAIAATEQGSAYEIIAHHLNEALATFSELTGKSVSEAAMDAVFREFCVGK